MDKKIILSRIDQLMEEKHISAYKLKENADISSTIYQWRKNATRDKERIPTLRSIEKICNFLGVSLQYFFTFDTEEQHSVRSKELAEKISKLPDDQIYIIELMIDQLTKVSSNEH